MIGFGIQTLCRYIMKMDDDNIVNVPVLQHWLTTRDEFKVSLGDGRPSVAVDV